jgi:hypothetical protein
MRATQFKRQIANVFSTAKCPVAIAVFDAPFRDALILAALDSSVRSIEFLSHASLSKFSFAINGLVLVREDGRHFLDIQRPNEVRHPDDEDRLAKVLEARGIAHLKVDSEYLRREPLFSNSREVWRHHRHHVPFADRLQIIGCLAEDGPQCILDLECRISPTTDVGPSLCALACADLIELELAERPLGPRTIVRERR